MNDLNRIPVMKLSDYKGEVQMVYQYRGIYSNGTLEIVYRILISSQRLI